MPKKKLTERITTRIDEEQSVAINEYMANEGIGKEGEVVRMALTQFLRAKGYLQKANQVIKQAAQSTQAASETLENRGNEKVKAARKKKE
jgi:hypothetical protein